MYRIYAKINGYRCGGPWPVVCDTLEEVREELDILDAIYGKPLQGDEYEVEEVPGRVEDIETAII